MQLDIRGHNLTPAVMDHVERRLRFALSRFGDTTRERQDPCATPRPRRYEQYVV